MKCSCPAALLELAHTCPRELTPVERMRDLIDPGYSILDCPYRFDIDYPCGEYLFMEDLDEAVVRQQHGDNPEHSILLDTNIDSGELALAISNFLIAVHERMRQ